MEKIFKPTIFFLFLFIAFSTTTLPNNRVLLPGDEDYVAFAEEMAQPVGGMGSIHKGVSYPSMAKQARVEGKVFLLAYINENGGVDEVKVIKGIGAGCDEAAALAVKRCKFSPAKNKGQAVKSKLSLSIVFKL